MLSVVSVAVAVALAFALAVAVFLNFLVKVERDQKKEAIVKRWPLVELRL